MPGSKQPRQIGPDSAQMWQKVPTISLIPHRQLQGPLLSLLLCTRTPNRFPGTSLPRPPAACAPSQSSPSRASSGAAATLLCGSRCTRESKSSTTSSLIWATPDSRPWKGSASPGASQGTRSCCNCPSGPTNSANSSIATAELPESAIGKYHPEAETSQPQPRAGEGRGVTSVRWKSLLPLPLPPFFGIGSRHSGPASSGHASRGRFSRLRRRRAAVLVTVEDGGR